MLRSRLITSLVFNLVLAVWVLHDARRRRARKPVFAAVLAVLWGPLGLGLWESDRPLRAGERRHGTRRAIAAGFLRGWTAMLPAIAVLVWDATAHRAAVPGSFAREAGLLPAALATIALVWGVPAMLAGLLGWTVRVRAVEHGTTAVAEGSAPPWLGAAVAGIAALLTALATR